jgi:hypothetical protein
MKYTIICAVLSGFISAFLSGESAIESVRGFSYFILFYVPFAILGANLDSDFRKVKQNNKY